MDSNEDALISLEISCTIYNIGAEWREKNWMNTIITKKVVS